MKTRFLFSLLIATLAVLIFSCSARKAKPNSKYASSYVYAYTGGAVAKKAPIRIRFANPLVAETEIGKPVANGVFSISPSLKGQAIWEDTQTIVFKQTENLETDENYVAAVRIDRLFQGVPSDCNEFQFEFRAKKQFYEVVVEGLQTKEISNPADMQLQGYVKTSDACDEAKLESILTAKQGGTSLSIGWKHDETNTHHAFWVNQITRGNVLSKVELAWNGEKIGVKKIGSTFYEVPALNDFVVIDAKEVDGVDKQVILNFSDPISSAQDLNGLVHFDQISTFNFAIDKNIVRVFSNSLNSGGQNIICEQGVQNMKGKTLGTKFSKSIFFGDDIPQVRLCGRGSIVPSSENGLMFPFEAKNLNAVTVEIFKIYNNNVMQFLQTSNLDNDYEYGLERVGRVVLQEKTNLTDINSADNKGKFVRYNLDLSKMIKDDPAAVYQIRVGFRPEYSIFTCEKTKNKGEKLTLATGEAVKDEDGEIISATGYNYGYEYEGEGDSEGGNDYNNPCNPNNSGRTFIRRNIIGSNVGVIAKMANDKSVFVAVTDLRSAQPIENGVVTFYDAQNQKMNEVKTNSEGIAKAQLDKIPYLCLVNVNKEYGYLKMRDGTTENLSRFSVGGDMIQKGIKGFIYGERGVWRPGDSIYLNFVLENKNNSLPPNHPLTFELTDPRGQVQQRFTTVSNVNNVYNLQTFTRSDAPTGTYNAKVKIGGTSFSKNIRIETVKPNRLKIKLDFGKDQLSELDKNLKGSLQSNWLTGPAAAGLNAKVDVQLNSIETSFDKYKDFRFEDPARKFFSEPQVLFEGNLDANGNAAVPLKFNFNSKAQGKIKANFHVKVMERGGDFSTDNFSMIYNPYEIYVGVKTPTSDEENPIKVGEDSKIVFVALDKNGNPARNVNINVGMYKIDWRWWWDSNEDNVSSFNSDAHMGSLKNEMITTNDKGEAVWNVKIDQWGRYFVRAINPEGGHATGGFFNAGMPSDEGNDANYNARTSATLLPFKSDKEKYQVGEKVVLEIPTNAIGRCLVTIESGTKVIKHFWADAKSGINKIDFKATAEMSPNVYAHVTMIQPHGQVTNDLPMRQYGVIPINVENKDARLEPWVKLPEVLEPEQTFTVDIGEKSSKPMTYTLAIVDEGLLDLTRFETPDPYGVFYAKEALGVKTWDIYDQVLSASYGVEKDRVLNIGGDGFNTKSGDGNRANRFKPVVKHLGPFYLAPGRKAHHQIKLPNYIGSVRVMVVASENGAYGNTQATVPVRKPLMLLATLPRVLSPGEQLKLPVDIFALDKKVTNVNVTVKESSGLINIAGGNAKSVYFSAPGEKQTDFDITVNGGEGVAKFRIEAEGGGEKVWQDIEIQVRNPNPILTNTVEKVLNPNESFDFDVMPVGTFGTNEGVLEISTIPPLNLGTRLPYLLNYPHGCVEQTTSSAFPQIYVTKFLELNDAQKNIAKSNVQAGIQSLQKFQTNNGGFGYWPGDPVSNPYASTYVGHFLIEAQKNGFTLPPNMLENWKNYQLGIAKRWDPTNSNRYYSEDGEQLDQAYRLYTLALAGAPEFGSMNRLRELKTINVVTRWRLGAAYAAAGKFDEARKLTTNIDKKVASYTEISDTYGSDLRDEAQILETLLLLGDKNSAAEVARSVSAKMSSQTWYGTQSVAQSLLAMSKFLGDNSTQNGFTYNFKTDKNNWANNSCKAALAQQVVAVDKGVRKVSFKNTSKGVIFARLILSGKPAIGNQNAASNNLNMNIAYKNTKGEAINPESIVQGTDFIAEVTVRNPGNLGKNYKELAISQVFPSGWEIHNARMNAVTYGAASSNADYQDIRDDRVYTYFDLPKNQAVTYRIQLHAAYIGKYYLPTTLCDAMYDHSIMSQVPGRWINVVKGAGPS
jgi:alpha-2-macroglobulin